MNGYRRFSWFLGLVLLVGSVMTPHVAVGAEPELSNVISLRQNDLQDCGRFDTNCDDEEEEAPRFEYESPDNDTCSSYNCDEEEETPRFEYEPSDNDTCSTYNCDEEEEAPRFEYESPDNDEGAPRLERTPFPGPDNDECSNTTYEQIRGPSGSDLTLTELDCGDDPWNGSTDGCHSYSSFCEDDSYLVDCSYVTANTFGSAEGACDVPFGQSQLENCYPVSGPSNRFVYDNDPNTQTFRCHENGTISGGGYSIDDITSFADDDVVLLLCSSAPGLLGGPDEDSCENAPRGVNYYTCEVDDRFFAPGGTDSEWYICAK